MSDEKKETSELGKAPRQPEPGEVLRARPVSGEIDYTALIREHMARYPKIIAALHEAEKKCGKQ